MIKFTNPLNNIKIASPCSADWNEMIGDERSRFCGDCNLNVYNLSGMTEREAENLLINSEGRLCVRFYRRADGTVLTKDCPIGWAAIKSRVSKTAAAFASLIIGLLTSLGFVSLFNQPKETLTGALELPRFSATPKERFVMGDIAAPTPTPKTTPSPKKIVEPEMGAPMIGKPTVPKKQ